MSHVFKKSRIKNQKKKQRGFSLIEIMAGIVIVSIMAAILVANYSGDSSKATKLFSDMTTMRDSLNRAKMELGGVPKKLSVLWSQPDAAAANMFNGVNATTTWNGPYIERQSTDASDNITFPTIADDARVSIAREAASATVNGGNYAWVYYLRAIDIPNPIIVELMKKCTGVDITTVSTVPSFVNSSCRASLGSGTTEFGTVDIKITDSR